MTVTADRVQEMTRDVIIGKPKDQIVQTPEEEALWDQLVPQVNAIREAGIPDVPFEAEAMDYHQDIYRPGGRAAVEATETGASALTAAPPPLDPDAPPMAHFTDPKFTEPTSPRIDQDGRYYGHLAVWGTCHTTHTARSKCITPPRNKSGYAHFLTGHVLTAEGQTVSTGVITLDTGHADDTFSMRRALAHYDNTGLGVADVVMGEDRHGIWFSGSLRPGLTSAQVRTLRASPLSGDWRERTQYRGDLELVAALAVNVQGFPVPRPKGLVASGAMHSLVAAGMLPPKVVRRSDIDSGRLTREDLHYLKSLANREKAMQQREANEVRDHHLSEAGKMAMRLSIEEMASTLSSGA